MMTFYTNLSAGIMFHFLNSAGVSAMSRELMLSAWHVQPLNPYLCEHEFFS